ncbi:hypothetical protein L4P85_006445, partial [Pseudomonas aeruginosa]
SSADTVRRLRDALGKGDWFSELFALSGLAWAVAEVIIVKINLSPFSFMIGQGILLDLKTRFPENCL